MWTLSCVITAQELPYDRTISCIGIVLYSCSSYQGIENLCLNQIKSLRMIALSLPIGYLQLLSTYQAHIPFRSIDFNRPDIECNPDRFNCSVLAHHSYGAWVLGLVWSQATPRCCFHTSSSQVLLTSHEKQLT